MTFSVIHSKEKFPFMGVFFYKTYFLKSLTLFFPSVTQNREYDLLHGYVNAFKSTVFSQILISLLIL